MSGCNCRDCAEGRISRAAFRHGGEDWETDYDELVRYKKPSRSNWNGKKKRPCKKSKTGEQCEFTVKKVIGTYHTRIEGKLYPRNDYMMTCHRCGKYGWHLYDWRF